MMVQQAAHATNNRTRTITVDATGYGKLRLKVECMLTISAMQARIQYLRYCDCRLRSSSESLSSFFSSSEAGTYLSDFQLATGRRQEPPKVHTYHVRGHASPGGNVEGTARVVQHIVRRDKVVHQRNDHVEDECAGREQRVDRFAQFGVPCEKMKTKTKTVYCIREKEESKETSKSNVMITTFARTQRKSNNGGRMREKCDAEKKACWWVATGFKSRMNEWPALVMKKWAMRVKCAKCE